MKRIRIKKGIATIMSMMMLLGCLNGCSVNKKESNEAYREKMSDKMIEMQKRLESEGFDKIITGAFNHVNEYYIDDVIDVNDWSVIGIAYVYFWRTEYISKKPEEVEIGDSLYYIVEETDIEELCNVYYGEMLPKEEILVSGDEIDEESLIIYSEKNDVYYVRHGEGGLYDTEISAIKKIAEDELEVTIDYLYYVKGDELIVSKQHKLRLKYNEDVRMGFVISQYEYLDHSANVKAAKKKLKEEEIAGIEKLMQQIIEDEEIWYNILYHYAYAEKNCRRTYNAGLWPVAACVAGALDGTKYDNNEIEILDVEGTTYVKVDKSLCNDIFLLTDFYGIDKNDREHLGNQPGDKFGYYDKKEKAYYLKKPDVKDRRISVTDYKIKELRPGDSYESVPYRIIVKLMVEDNETGKHLGDYNIRLDVNENRRFGFEIYKTSYEKWYE